MDKSLWESLLDDINSLKRKAPSSDVGAPKIQSLLRQVAELAGTAHPATGGERKGIASDFSAPEEGGWRDSADRAKTDGRFTVDLPALHGGIVFRQKPESADRVDLTPDKATAMFRQLVAKDGMTDEDFDKAESLASWIEGLSATDRKAYEDLPVELKTFYQDAGRVLRGKFSAPMPTAGDWNATSDERSDWNKWTREATGQGLRSAFGAVLGKAFVKGVVDTPANLGEGVNNFIGNEELKAAIEQYRTVVETHLGRLPEFKDLKSLDRAELVGSVVGEWITSGGMGMAAKGVIRSGGMAVEGVRPVAGKVAEAAKSGAGKAVEAMGVGAEKVADAAKWTAGTAFEGAKWVRETASEKVRAALEKMPREQVEGALKAAKAIITKLKQSPSMEKVMESAGKVKEAARKAVEAAPEAAEIGAGAAIAGGETTHDLKKEGLSDSEAKAGGRITSLVDAWISAGAKKFLPKEMQWVSDLVRGSASKGIKDSAAAMKRRQRERAGSRLPPVEDLRKRLIDG